MINHSSAKTYNVVTGQPKEDPYVAAHDNERLKKKIEIECREYNLESTDATELHNIYQNNLNDHRKAQAERTRKKYEIQNQARILLNAHLTKHKKTHIHNNIRKI